jgi:hypothetical protein
MSRKIIYILFLFLPSLLTAQLSTDFFGGNNLNIEAKTIFQGDLTDGSTGLETTMSIGLWFEHMGYSDRGIFPVKDDISVSLNLANAAIYAWRGYTVKNTQDMSFKPDNVGSDQANSIWFNDISAEIIFGSFWIKAAGLKPKISVSQASVFSVFDSIMANTTAKDKNELPLPLFSSGNWYVDGIKSVIGRDLLGAVNIPKSRQVPVGGILSAGYKGDDIIFDISAGSFKNGKDNNDNSWVTGFNLDWKPNLNSKINISSLGAFNYENSIKEDEKLTVISKNPLALGVNYEVRIKLKDKAILKPVIGADIFYNQIGSKFLWEAGGGIKLYPHGSNSSYGYSILGGSGEVGLFISANINQDNMVNGIVSFNESPKTSLIPNLGGFLQAEFMNITGTGGKDFLWAGIGYMEYLIKNNMKIYAMEKFIPGDIEDHTYSWDRKNFNTKIGIKLSPLEYFNIDFSYQRNDKISGNKKEWDAGIISTEFKISM